MDESIAAEEMLQQQQQKKKGCGRRKIEMDKISNINKRRTSLSKRHQSLFKKAAKIKELCPGAYVAVIVQYPSGKYKTSGTYSEVYSVIDRFLAEQGDLGQQLPILNPDCAGTSRNSDGEVKVSPEIDQNANEDWAYPEIWSGDSNIFDCGIRDEGFQDGLEYIEF